jgi:hypothetical protein
MAQQRASSPLRVPEQFEYQILLDYLTTNLARNQFPERPIPSWNPLSGRFRKYPMSDVVYHEDVPGLITKLNDAIQTGEPISDVMTLDKLKKLTKQLSELSGARSARDSAANAEKYKTSQWWHSLTPAQQDAHVVKREDDDAAQARAIASHSAHRRHEFMQADADRLCPEHNMHPDQCRFLEHSVKNYKINNGEVPRGGKSRSKKHRSKSKSKKGKKSHRRRSTRNH